MALDLYQRLGLKRGASEAEIKKAYRSLAKQLHPDRNKDNPNAAKRFSEVTAAYDLLSDKDKRAQYDRGEIDEEGNPKMPFGAGFGGYSAGPQPGASQGFENFNFGSEGADLSDLFEGLFGGGASGGRQRGGPFSGFRIVLVAVGVQLLGEAAIRLLDFGLGRAALNSEPLVQVHSRSMP